MLIASPDDAGSGLPVKLGRKAGRRRLLRPKINSPLSPIHRRHTAQCYCALPHFDVLTTLLPGLPTKRKMRF